jgi:glucose-6-phosphate isomerase
MFSLDVTGCLAKTITPSYGVSQPDLTGLNGTMKRHVEDLQKEKEAGQHAWMLDPSNTHAIAQVKEVAKRVKKEKFQTVVWIGIGGSGLGPKVLQEAFEGPKTMEFIVLDTIDPAVLEMTIAMLDWKSTMVVVVSKSGGTLESMSAFFLLWDKLKKALGGKAARHALGITDPRDGELRAFCLKHGIDMLPIPTEVGGRYCIFTPVGLLPLALLDADVDEFCRGALDMDSSCRAKNLEDNPAALLASIQFLLDTKKSYPIRVIMPYSQRLMSMARWNQQLIAESLGKTEVSNPFPLAAIGTQDQHSLLQQWMAGPRKSWHLFIREVEKPRLTVPDDLEEPFSYIAGKSFGQLLDACYDGTSRALTSAKRPHATISLTRLDEYHVGQLFYALLLETVLLGKLYRIDPYGQPAVEIGKKITKEILSHGRGE